MLEKLETQLPLVVKVEYPELDIAYCDAFAKDLARADGVPNVIVDLSAVTYMDSTCLSKLIFMRKTRSSLGLPQEALVICSPSLRRVLKVVGLDEMWPIFESVDDAVRGTATFS
jgi:anti-anti-sigma factor